MDDQWTASGRPVDGIWTAITRSVTIVIEKEGHYNGISILATYVSDDSCGDIVFDNFAH